MLNMLAWSPGQEALALTAGIRQNHLRAAMKSCLRILRLLAVTWCSVQIGMGEQGYIREVTAPRGIMQNKA
jgi:hypothetical protein